MGYRADNRFCLEILTDAEDFGGKGSSVSPVLMLGRATSPSQVDGEEVVKLLSYNIPYRLNMIRF
jgi:hypothetical protein